MIDREETITHLRNHVAKLTVEIGERSVFFPANHRKAAEYIEAFYQGHGFAVEMAEYHYKNMSVANVCTELKFSEKPRMRYLVGAHYDSVHGTVGADDNASAVAVQLETARLLKAWSGSRDLDLAVKFVSFALEEPPAFNSRYRGSRVYARQARQANEQIDGMLCLEMVGYRCHQPGCQKYPFPLNFAGYPETGDFIGIVGNFKSRDFTRRLYRAFARNRELPVIKQTVPLSGWFMPSVRLSDHSSFWDQGYKAVMITDTAFYRNPHYHLESDTLDKLDFAFMAEVVRSLLLFFDDHRR